MWLGLDDANWDIGLLRMLVTGVSRTLWSKSRVMNCNSYFMCYTGLWDDKKGLFLLHDMNDSEKQFISSSIFTYRFSTSKLQDRLSFRALRCCCSFFTLFIHHLASCTKFEYSVLYG